MRRMVEFNCTSTRLVTEPLQTVNTWNL